MQDLYLSFQNETEANSVLYTNLIPNYQNIDVLGIVYESTPQVIPKDYVPVPYPAPNWGVNIRLLDGEDIEPLRPYIIELKNPIRVWG